MCLNVFISHKVVLNVFFGGKKELTFKNHLAKRPREVCLYTGTVAHRHKFKIVLNLMYLLHHRSFVTKIGQNN